MRSERGQLSLAFLAMLCIGTIYSWSIVSAPLAECFSWSSAQLGVVFTITMSSFCLGGLAAGKLLARIRSPILLRGAACAIFCGYTITALLQGALTQLCLGYAVLGGGGVGVAYTVILARTGTGCSKERQALRTGLLLMAFGSGSMLFSLLAAWLLESGMSWRWIFLATGVAGAFTVTAFSMHLPLKGTSASRPRGSAAAMLRHRRYWLFFALISLSNGIGTALIGNARPILLSFGAAAGITALSVGAMSVANGASRFAFGALCAAKGQNTALCADATAYTMALAAITASACLHSDALGFLGFLLAGLAYGGVPTVTAACVAAEYGDENYAANLSAANLSLMLGSALSSVVGRLIGQGGGGWLFVLLALLLPIWSLVLLLKRPA